jgi:hypothetical protein
VTDGTNDKKRPNDNYKLSKPDGKIPARKEELVFYYNRDRRLEKAPQAVKELYEEKKQNRFSLIKPLVADKPRAFVFFSIIIICVFIILFSIMGYLDGSYSLDENRILIKGTRFEGTTIIILKKTVKKGVNSAYTGAVDIVVSPVTAEEENYQIETFRYFFTNEPIQECRFVVPFDVPELSVILQTEKNSLKVKLLPE